MDTKIKYWDNASTTRIDDRVFEAMVPFFKEFFGNASSSHDFGMISKEAVEISRQKVAELINCFDDEIFFTSGATESINLALKGFTEANVEKGNHIITVKTEHKAVLATCEYLEKQGFEVTYLEVDRNGLISLKDLERAIKQQTVLICVMYVNNETGVIQPIKEIGKIAHKHAVAFFTDATQAIGKIKVDIEADNVDLLCFSGHKINGPKGIGILYKRNKINITPLIHGGSQERGLRGGTYNSPLIVGLGKACELALEEYEERKRSLWEKREQVINYVKENNIGSINFDEVDTVPNILSLTLFEDGSEEFLLKNAKKFIASTGSACNSGLIEQSHVIRNIPGMDATKIIRISI